MSFFKTECNREGEKTKKKQKDNADILFEYLHGSILDIKLWIMQHNRMKYLKAKLENNNKISTLLQKKSG